MMNRSSIAIVTLATLAGCLMISAVGAAAESELPCVKKWGKPQTKEDAIKQCDPGLHTDAYVDWLRQKVAIIIFPLLLSAVAICAMPFVFCARYCCGCCGGYKQRPGDCCCGSPHWDTEAPEMVMAQYSDMDRSCAKFFPLSLIIFCIIFVAICVSGTASTVKGIDGISIGVMNGVNFIRGVLTNFIADTANPATGTTVMTLSNFSDFTTNLDNIEEFVLHNESYLDGVKLAKQISHQLTQATAGPVIVVVLTVVCAMANLRTCLPCLNACANFLFIFVFGFIASILLLIHLPLTVVCGEVNAQLDRQPGLVQYYYVPQCEVNNTLKKVKEDFDKNVVTAANDGCNAIREFCGQRGSTDNNQIFTCDYTILNTVGSACTNFNQVSRFAASMELKTNQDANAVCSGQTNCSLCVCGNSCNDASLKSSASRACADLENARLLTDSFEKNIKPILDCNVLFDQLVMIAKPMCDNLPKGLYLLGVGFTIICLVGIMVICANLRGQKRWFKKPEGYVGMMTSGQMNATMLQENGGIGSGGYGQPTPVHNITHVYNDPNNMQQGGQYDPNYQQQQQQQGGQIQQQQGYDQGYDQQMQYKEQPPVPLQDQQEQPGAYGGQYEKESAPMPADNLV